MRTGARAAWGIGVVSAILIAVIPFYPVRTYVDLVGQSVNVAARVSDLAGPGELLVSEELVGAFAGDLIDFEMHPVGPVRVRGVQTPIWLHRLSF